MKTGNPKIAPFDFDSWMRLATSDPEEFERQRGLEIEAAIADAPEYQRERLRHLQWRIDMERRRCRTPLSACVRISGLMWEFVHAENGFLAALNSLSGKGKPVAVNKMKSSARILPFKRPGTSGHGCIG